MQFEIRQLLHFTKTTRPNLRANFQYWYRSAICRGRRSTRQAAQRYRLLPL